MVKFNSDFNHEMNIMDYQEAEQIFHVIRSEWHFADLESQKDLNEERTQAHNALISNCDMLARNMKKAEEDDSWRIKLGTDRKRIGDFACLVHALIGIEAR